VNGGSEPKARNFSVPHVVLCYSFAMKYDDASWHYGGDFPAASPPEYGATHIALFLKWCFRNGWAGELHLNEWPEDVQAVIDGTNSATSFFLRNCDGKLTDEDLSEAGNAFAQRYYGKDGLYLDDYAKDFLEHMYVTSEDALDYPVFSAMIERRLKSGILTKAEVGDPKLWWKFW
jgi:hypothetical protein